MLGIIFLVFFKSSGQGGVHGFGSMMFGLVGAKALEY